MKLRHLLNYLSLALITILIVGCTSSSNIEATGDASIANDMTIETIEVTNSTGDTFDGTDVVSMMTEATSDQVTEYGLRTYGTEGTPYKLEIDIIQYSKGNAVARWMIPGAGKTVLSVEARMTDSYGVIVAKSQATESIGAGGLYTIGAWKRVFNKVAQSLVSDIAELIGREKNKESRIKESRINKRELLRVQ